MKKHAYLSIDLGNSSTRIHIACLDAENKPISRLRTINNRYGYIDNSTRHIIESADYTPKNSKVFAMGNETVCVGKICSTECGFNSIKPTSTDKKFDSKFSKYAIRLAIMEGYMELSKMLDVELDDLDVVWHVAACLPAYDYNIGKEKMKELIAEVDEIDFQIPEFRKRINLDPKISVRPEGFTAYIGTVFENLRLYRYQMKSVAKTNVLVVDMGDGTTDLSIIQGMTLGDDSLHSIPRGGSSITQGLKKAMEQRYGHSFSLDAMQEASITGVLKLGNREIDITEDVDRIRRKNAISVANAIKGYFDTISISIDEINYVLLCGGGADKTPVDGMQPYATYIQEELQGMMKYVDFLDMPMVKQIEKNGEEELVSINPRMLNVIGLGILNSPATK